MCLSVSAKNCGGRVSSARQRALGSRPAIRCMHEAVLDRRATTEGREAACRQERRAVVAEDCCCDSGEGAAAHAGHTFAELHRLRATTRRQASGEPATS